MHDIRQWIKQVDGYRYPAKLGSQCDLAGLRAATKRPQTGYKANGTCATP